MTIAHVSDEPQYTLELSLVHVPHTIVTASSTDMNWIVHVFVLFRCANLFIVLFFLPVDVVAIIG